MLLLMLVDVFVVVNDEVVDVFEVVIIVVVVVDVDVEVVFVVVA